MTDRSAARSVTEWLGLVLALVLIAGGLYLLYTLTQPASVTVTWETGSERDVIGFNLWRSDPALPVEVPVRKVNATPVPSRGNALSGAVYTVVDHGVEMGATYIYQIEELDASGAGKRHRDTVTLRAGLPRAWVLAEALGLIAVGALLFRVGRRSRQVTESGPAPVDSEADAATPSLVGPTES